MKNLKHFLKKYYYIIAYKFANYVISFKHRLKAYLVRDHSKLSYEPLEIGELPYPTRWHDLGEFDSINIEIGCGHGELLAALATEHPRDLYVGFEVTKTYTLKTSRKLEALSNAFVFKADAYTATLNLFGSKSVSKIYILFPDPWHKKKHHKRRPLIEDWFRDVHEVLQKDGQIFFATDWPEYFEFVSAEFSDLYDLYRIETGRYDPVDQNLPETHYYKKWVAEGREFRYIRATKL